MDKVKCTCGVKGIPGSKCKVCSTFIPAKDAEMLIMDTEILDTEFNLDVTEFNSKVKDFKDGERDE